MGLWTIPLNSWKGPIQIRLVLDRDLDIFPHQSPHLNSVCCHTHLQDIHCSCTIGSRLPAALRTYPRKEQPPSMAPEGVPYTLTETTLKRLSFLETPLSYLAAFAAFPVFSRLFSVDIISSLEWVSKLCFYSTTRTDINYGGFQNKAHFYALLLRPPSVAQLHPRHSFRHFVLWRQIDDDDLIFIN